MPTKIISQMDALADDLADDDLLAVVDSSDLTDSVNGTTKRMDAQQIVAKRLKTTTGPTVLDIGAVVDGEFLKRSGSTIVSDSVAAGPATQIEETSGPTVLDIGDIVDGEFLKRVGGEIVSDTAGGGTPAGSSGDIQYNNAGALGAAPLVREDADTVGLYDTSNTSENPSRLNIYALKNGANLERLSLYYDTSNDKFVIGPSNGGTGVLRRLEFQMAGTAFWRIETSGHLRVVDTAARLSLNAGAANDTALQFGGSSGHGGFGLFAPTVGEVGVSTGSGYRVRFHDWGAQVGSLLCFAFSSTALGSGTAIDAALERDGAGVIRATQTSTGASGGITTYGDLKARAFRCNAVTVANLPGSPVQGMIASVTDSTTTTWGATVTGGGSSKALVWYNGTNWTVIGA